MSITVTFSHDEALVLFEMLSTIDEDNAVDAGTSIVINNLICEFEKELVEPMQPDYEQLLEAAKNRLTEGRTI